MPPGLKIIAGLARGAAFGSALSLCAQAAVAQQVTLKSDFNGDGFDDLAIGIPGESVNGKAKAGAIAILVGGPDGLHHDPRNQAFHRDLPDIPGEALDGEQWGSVLETGDFNGDGISDLAVGAPKGDDNRGSVIVFLGSTSGLATLPQIFQPNSSDQFVFYGSALAAGDFNGNGRDELAVGISDAFGAEGAVQILDGVEIGLDLGFDALLRRRSLPSSLGQVKAEKFGAALAAGDFNKDGFSDLAIGSPARDTDGGTGTNEGRAYFVFGSDTGLKPEVVQAFNQDSSLVLDQAETGDVFAALLLAGDFDGNLASDIAIAVPREGHESVPAVRGGAVATLYGFSGISAQNNQFWHQNQPAVPGVVETGDHFGDQ